MMGPQQYDWSRFVRWCRERPEPYSSTPRVFIDGEELHGLVEFNVAAHRNLDHMYRMFGHRVRAEAAPIRWDGHMMVTAEGTARAHSLIGQEAQMSVVFHNQVLTFSAYFEDVVVPRGDGHTLYATIRFIASDDVVMEIRR